MKRIPIITLILITGLTGFVYAQQTDASRNLFDGQFAPLLDGMGDTHFEISTDKELVQKFFNQAIILAFAFNHAEAERSFRQAAELAPDHPMPWWGIALVQGPNLNVPMMEPAIPVAWEALQKAEELKANGSRKEQDLISALSTRYEVNPPEDRTSLDIAYANAMEQLAESYPDDQHIKALYAEALMDLHPWDFWTKNGDPQPWTPKILEVLESVIEVNPHHIGVNHLYIHATEASKTPELALESANNLRLAVPGAGHLVHMPSHTYIRVGEYHEGTLANQRAIQTDTDYVAQCNAQGVYPLVYVPHNQHFLWATATLEGRRNLSVEAAHQTADLVHNEAIHATGIPLLEHFKVIPLFAYVRFGMWDEIMAHPVPGEGLFYSEGIWHYAQGKAYSAHQDFELAEQELGRIITIAEDETIELDPDHRNLLKIARYVLEGEIAAGYEDYETAISKFNKALVIENEIPYDEPPKWFYPVRQKLGAVLLDAGKAAEAESVYREDLDEFPRNGWSLFGLWQSLEAQGKSNEANQVKTQFDEAWKHADIELTASVVR
jgi:tetratricopeptide (TPR) repeat protein